VHSIEQNLLSQLQALDTLRLLYRIIVVLGPDVASNLVITRWLERLTKTLSVPVILLAGLCSPSFEAFLCQVAGFSLDSTLIIRQCAVRFEIGYSLCHTSESELFPKVKDYTSNAFSKMEAVDRLIIFCETIVICEKLKELLGMPVYHEQLPTPDKELISDAWHEGLSGQGLITTGHLRGTIHYPHVRFVIHCGAPRSLHDLDQAINHAGRDGKTAYSMIFYSSIPSIDEATLPDPLGVKPLYHMLSNPNQCLRITRDVLWDGNAHSCASLNGAVYCGVCEILNVRYLLFSVL
jgi:hypothetical protein